LHDDRLPSARTGYSSQPVPSTIEVSTPLAAVSERL
jgi:hypothetical protein